MVYKISIMNPDLKLSIDAAIEAGDIIMEIYNKDFQVFEKEDLSPLTEADNASNEIINRYLENTEIPIISEENKEIDYEERKKWSTCWLVDPVDGTKEFIKKNGEFTVNIALIENNKPVLGVIYVPVTKELYYADVREGYSCKLIVLNSEVSEEDFKNSTRLKGDRNFGEELRIVGSRSHMNTETVNYIKSLEVSLGKKTTIVSKGSSLKFCLIAENKADIYPRFAPTMEWDTAAGQAICNAIGIAVINDETKEELTYNKENLLNPWFICK